MSVLVVLKKTVFFLLLFSHDKHFLWHRCGMRGTQRTLTTIRKPTGPPWKKSPNVSLPCLRTSEQELETFFGSKTKEKRDLLFIVWRPPCSIQPIFGDCSDCWWGQCWPQCCLCYEKPYNQNIFDIVNIFKYSEYLWIFRLPLVCWETILPIKIFDCTAMSWHFSSFRSHLCRLWPDMDEIKRAVLEV